MTDEDATPVGKARRTPDLSLAYGVALHSTERGIVVEAEKVHLVRLADPRVGRTIVDAFARATPVETLALEPGNPAVAGALGRLRDLGATWSVPRRVVIADRLGLSVDVRAAELRHAELASDIDDACDLAILVAARDDARLGDYIARCHALDIRALVVWTSPGEVVAVVDEPSAAPCSRCALLFDACAATLRGGLPHIDRSAVSEHVRVERQFAAAVIARYAAPGATIAPGAASVWNVREGTAAHHRFSRHPACACASRADRNASKAIATAWDELKGARFSPIVPLEELRSVARVAYRGTRAPWPLSRDGFGLALAAGANARARAVGEGIERFAMLHAPADVIGRPQRELQTVALPEPAIASLLYRDDERCAPGFRFPAFSPDLPVDWSWATRAMNDERVLVPTSLVGRPSQGGARLADGTSNGYACHPVEDQAKLRALLEVVERDALLLRWYTTQPPMRVEGVDCAPGVVVMLASVDIELPVVIAAACLPDGGLRIGSAAGTSFDVALARATDELEGQIAGPPSGEAPPDLSRADRGYGPRDHVAYYDGPAGRALLETWGRAAPSIAASLLRARWPGMDDASSLRVALAAVTRAGLDVLFVDRSLPELFGGEWHVVRALVPGAVEMSWGMAYRRLASPRIAVALASGAALSPWPHPYA